ncbi:Transcription factor TFIIIB component B [Rhizopus azygosporus]|uniref:Transcription factor TFIIIB component B n=1 Tax=Rhizopus azygosporus TaxID=86630 RepID=A0A367IYW0_RHIAZ|nr:Transcription factor TFIIIB component B [Rhizopus azygosporus]
MSSLTSIGVNKNKKKFGPTLKSKPRANRQSTNNKTADSSQASSSASSSSQLNNKAIQHEPKKAAKAEELTEEEMAINMQLVDSPTVAPIPSVATTSHNSHRPNRPIPRVIAEPDDDDDNESPPPSDVNHQSLFRATVTEETEIAIKNEQLTPDNRIKSRLASEEVPIKHSPPSIDTSAMLSEDHPMSEQMTVEEQVPSDNHPMSEEVIVDVLSEEQAPSEDQTMVAVPSEEPSSSSTSTQPKRLAQKKGKEKAKESDASDFFEPRTKKPKTTPISKPKKTSGKSDGGSSSSSKPKKTGSGGSSSNKATAVAISIGAPSSATPEPEDKDSEFKNIPGRRKNKTKDVYDFRLPENMKTLDDISEDPAKPEMLDKPMSFFTKDIDGVVSKAFKEMEMKRFEEIQKLEEAKQLSPEKLEEFKRKQEEEAEKKRKAEEERRAEEKRLREEKAQSVLKETSTAPQVRIVNGQIVLDTESLTVERSQAGGEIYEGDMEIVEESAMTRKVNSHTYGKRQPSSRWSAAETEAFYDLLSQFGTDFETISKAMPNRSRAQIRLKFNKEEKLHPEKITEYLITKRKPADLEKYKEIAGIEELEAVPDDFHEMQLV